MRTDATGAFTIPSVLPGSYELLASAGNPPERSLESIVVADSEIVDHALWLRPNSSVRGRVRFEAGEAPGAPLTVIATNPNWRVPSAAAVTDATWAFDLPLVRGEGLLRLTTLPSGWWLKSVTLARRDITNDPVDLSDGAAGVEILVSKRMATVSGAIESPDGVISPNVSILIFSQESSRWIPGSTMIRRLATRRRSVRSGGAAVRRL